MGSAMDNIDYVTGIGNSSRDPNSSHGFIIIQSMPDSVIVLRAIPSFPCRKLLQKGRK